MEVILTITPPTIDFDRTINSPRSSVHVSSDRRSPKRLSEYYFSAPTSPSHHLTDDDDFFASTNDTGTVPFNWEEKPGTPKSPKNDDDQFAFDLSRNYQTAPLSAAELFSVAARSDPIKPPGRRATRSVSPLRNDRSEGGQKKWRLKDIFLFRSASEGRADEKDALKYTAAVNRAVTEGMRKKKFLPYKPGILGRFSFNPATGFGFSRK